jgi:ABC-type branched-subunit amino acid transport system ATPase component
VAAAPSQTFEGANLSALPAEARARLGIGYVPQGRDIFPQLTVEAGVTIPFVEQKLPFARRVASEFYRLDKGHRVAGGSFGELTADVVREHLSV